MATQKMETVARHRPVKPYLVISGDNYSVVRAADKSNARRKYRRVMNAAGAHERDLIIDEVRPFKAKPLTQKATAALLKSIGKWRKIVDGTGVDLGTENCALCEAFFGPDHPTPNARCVGCPISGLTGQEYCGGTPYDFFNRASTSVDTTNMFGMARVGQAAKTEVAKLHALRMLELLQALLPKAKRKVL